MFYREAGQFKTSYAADQAIFPIAQDRWFSPSCCIAAYFVPPLFLGDYWFNAILIPFLIFAHGGTGTRISWSAIAARSRSAPAGSWRSAPMPATS